MEENVYVVVDAVGTVFGVFRDLEKAQEAKTALDSDPKSDATYPLVCGPVVLDKLYGSDDST